MSQIALTQSGREIAIELHRLLKEIDPSRWRAELQARAQSRAATIAQMIRDSRAAHAMEDKLANLNARLQELARLMEAHLPARDLPRTEARDAWQAFRTRMAPHYENLARGLREHAVHVPSLRPTNYARSAFHVGSGLFALSMIYWVLSPLGMFIVAAAFASWAWSMEFFRRRSPALNDRLMRAFGKVSHPHEAWRVNSATWYATALLMLSLTGRPLLCAIAVIVLGLADPAAGLIGRRWGRTKLVNGRSLEGSSTFFLVGTLAAFGVATGLYGLAVLPALILAVSAALPATLAELFSRVLDDNFTVPVAAAVGGWIALASLGL
jgi:dolichol kinase